jgi:hypothetical protein
MIVGKILRAAGPADPSETGAASANVSTGGAHHVAIGGSVPDAQCPRIVVAYVSDQSN